MTVLAAVVGLYLLFTFLIMPIFTRHWQRVEVPDVTNLSGRAAEKILKKSGLKPVVSEIKYDERMPNGFVVFQNPGGHAVVKKNRRVYLTVSKGKRPIVMPKLVGLSERDARFLINQSQLVIGEVQRTFDSYYPAGVVTQQSIPPQTEVTVGDKVDLVISTGAVGGTVIMPNLIGMKFEEASKVVEQAGLSLGIVRYGDMPAAAPDMVVMQSPEPGTAIGAGQPVDLTLSIAGGVIEQNVDEAAPQVEATE